MEINYHIRLPGPFDRKRTALEIIYYVVRIVYVTILIVATLFALGGIVA
ncbi:hypothetical protein [Halalkalicoccus sp. NIPERK01]|nr:hypothetical protein [Halalkalicoccus sp. NIPERK01]MDL5362247.1 hypothetical protein [Halalkalicoccus sp. NIPERK01]